MNNPESNPLYSSRLENDATQTGAYIEDVDNKPEVLARRLARIREAAESHDISLDGAKILEIGSGDGKMLKLFQAHNLNAIGVDARPRGDNTDLAIAARVEILPFSNNSFDIVSSSQVFDSGVYDLQNQELMLKEIARVLRPGGIFTGELESEIDPTILAKITELEEIPNYTESVQRIFVKK